MDKTTNKQKINWSLPIINEQTHRNNSSKCKQETYLFVIKIKKKKQMKNNKFQFWKPQEF